MSENIRHIIYIDLCAYFNRDVRVWHVIRGSVTESCVDHLWWLSGLYDTKRGKEFLLRLAQLKANLAQMWDEECNLHIKIPNSLFQCCSQFALLLVGCSLKVDLSLVCDMSTKIPDNFLSPWSQVGVLSTDWSVLSWYIHEHSGIRNLVYLSILKMAILKGDLKFNFSQKTLHSWCHHDQCEVRYVI